MKKPIDKEYLENSFKNFNTEVLEKKYLHNNDSSIHSHENKNVLDKISESETGTLMFGGKEFIDGNTIDLSNYVQKTDDISDMESTAKYSRGTGSQIEAPYNIIVDTDGYPTFPPDFYQAQKIRKKFAVININFNSLVDKIKSNFSQHTHGSMKTITYSTTEPTSVSDGEIVMVYEE